MEINTNINLKIISKLKSEGVNSSIYLVKDEQLNSEFILKKIDKTTFKTRDMYFKESSKTYNLKHDNIIDIKYSSSDDEYIYIVMPYLKNGSLYNKIKDNNLTIREIIKYSLDFLSAIYYMHQNNTIHCDIKPNNILIDDNDRAVLSDFGSSQNLNRSKKARLKNVYYKHIAPEQCKNTLINYKVDIYQIGTTLYRMCNGNLEYNRQVKRYDNMNDLKIACSRGEFPKRKKYMPHIPKDMIKIIERCMEVNPDNRYENVLDIMNDLSKIDTNLDYRYCVMDKETYIWYLDEGKNENITMNKNDKLWKIVYRVNDENKEMLIESKAKSYQYIRNLIKDKKK